MDLVATTKATSKGAKLEVFQSLFDINAGFDRVMSGLAALSQQPGFDRLQLKRLRALSAETRSDMNSYLASVIEAARRPTRRAGYFASATVSRGGPTKNLLFRTRGGMTVWTQGGVTRMNLETRYLWLRTPVTLNSRFGDWRVCWLGGWTRHRMSYLVMLVRVKS